MKAAELSSGSFACAIPRTAVARITNQAERLLQHTIAAKLARCSLERNVLARVTTEAPSESLTEGSSETLNWFKHWWPVQLIYNLDTDRPNRIQLLGKYFVAWKGKNGEWVAMRDMCPHRLAPLSEGRVESDGTLMCSYHGWRFDESGKCVKIPQADDEKSHEAACNNPRSCATTFPCRERGGVLWVWPDCADTRFLDASAAALGLPDKYADYMERREANGLLISNTVDLPYDYNALVENLIDPSHPPFSHHKAEPTANRYKGGPISMRTIEPTSPNSITAAAFKGWLGESRTVELADRSLILYHTLPEEEGRSPSVVVLFLIPLQVGSSRVISSVIPEGVLTGNAKRPPFLIPILKTFPWIVHLFTINIFDGDTVLLHAQDMYLRQFGPTEWNSKIYFCPTSADLAVLEFRRWLSNEAGGGPFGAISVETVKLSPRRKLLDRKAMHMSQCKVCQQGIRFLNRTVAACKFISSCFLALAGILLYNLLQRGVAVKWKFALVAAAFVTFYSTQRLISARVLPMFSFVNYIHAERN